MDRSMLTVALSTGDTQTLFAKYGKNEDDRRLRLNPHSLRHLQNAELFRLGLADTFITKRFDRKSTTQSYEYDHSSLAEQLSQIELPPDIELALGEKAATVARMIIANRASGPIVEAFRRIQISEGDDAAFAYLKVEADGFHSTLWGHCLNSFTVDPCPKHLECFAGCRHLSAGTLPTQRERLVQLEAKLQSAVEVIEERPSNSVGRDNQLDHAKKRLHGVRQALATAPGQPVFPDGPDLSKKALTDRSVLDEN
jgi:hypothetical protein